MPQTQVKGHPMVPRGKDTITHTHTRTRTHVHPPHALKERNQLSLPQRDERGTRNNTKCITTKLL